MDAGSGPSARWLHSAAAAAGRFWIFGGKSCASSAWHVSWRRCALLAASSGFQQLTFSVFGDLWYFEDQAAAVRIEIFPSRLPQKWRRCQKPGLDGGGARLGALPALWPRLGHGAEPLLGLRRQMLFVDI